MGLFYAIGAALLLYLDVMLAILAALALGLIACCVYRLVTGRWPGAASPRLPESASSRYR